MMTPGEALIVFLLVAISWFLYQIAKQLSYMTGKRMRLPNFMRQNTRFKFQQKLKAKEEPIEKLPN